ncbi:mannitol dehydrogenase family protein [Arthrobacter zhangbolii]|uniref:Mannitol-1-phosphate 5-dehydrogenase n=1 Tax=Arthrobacter zhangbolii TaxID=2886936 RepID=A0A9X1M9I0_9MICC|nr:mannitol dehydrogenase family protein [Arthrobacter zhangbolii]MCC3272749.1 mannitol dehydrogenase family protein [Arthrobacter zhangbolii]UON91414.1 mannitol dehydrogenase family protein [Arthrobacter zhangbolii]
MWTETGPQIPPAGKAAPRLSRASLASAGCGSALGPAVDPGSLRTGMVHLGLGAFHRAHQAVYTEDAAAATGDTGWGILGVTGRSARVADTLKPQDGLYTVLTKAQPGAGSAADASLRIIGSLRGAVFPGRDTPLLLRALAEPDTRVLTLTVTEKGYPRDASGHLAMADGVAADRAALAADSRQRPASSDVAARTPLGLLARGLFARYRSSGAPLSVVSCDNLISNGALTRTLVTELAEAGGTGFCAWLQESVAFPSTMVDRIVPAATEADRQLGSGILGLRDEALVVAEPFGQWILEDAFAAARPAWELAGAVLTPDVAPFEAAKLRLLNGTHSLLAYLGALKGHATIADAAADEDLAADASALQAEAIRTLVPPPGVDLQEYSASILARFRNPALGHTTLQVAMDGSQKLPVRALATVADLLALGTVPEALARLVAAWMVFVYRQRNVHGSVLPLEDPLRETLAAQAAGPESGLVDRLLDLSAVFPPPVAGHPGFRAAVKVHAAELLAAVPGR